MKLNIIGSFLGTSGYARHTKELALALNKHCDVKVLTNLPNGWEREVNDEELLILTREDSADRINVIIDLPHNWCVNANKRLNIGFLVWEGDKVPKGWLNCFKSPKIVQIWVPSNHVKQSVENATTDKEILDKIRIVPHGVDRSDFYPENSNSPTFNFICNKGFRNPLDRGGIQHAIRAYFEEFKSTEDVNLILKLNPAYAMPHEHLMNYLRSFGLKDIPKVSVNCENLTKLQLKELYNQNGVFLNPTEAEAFSLPCAEAMACRKAIITTGFGGQTDFVNESNGWIIPYDLHEIKHELIYEGIKWGRPKIEALKKAMREAFEIKQLTNQKAEQALKDSANLTWNHSAERAINHLKEIS